MQKCTETTIDVKAHNYVTTVTEKSDIKEKFGRPLINFCFVCF